MHKHNCDNEIMGTRARPPARLSKTEIEDVKVKYTGTRIYGTGTVPRGIEGLLSRTGLQALLTGLARRAREEHADRQMPLVAVATAPLTKTVGCATATTQTSLLTSGLCLLPSSTRIRRCRASAGAALQHCSIASINGMGMVFRLGGAAIPPPPVWGGLQSPPHPPWARSAPRLRRDGAARRAYTCLQRYRHTTYQYCTTEYMIYPLG